MLTAMPAHRHSLRAVLLLLALLSVVVLGDAQRASCPMHGDGSFGSMASMMSGGAGAGMASGAMQDHHDGAPEQHDSHRCDCTCIGDCSATAPMATLPAATTIRVATIAAQPVRAPEVRTSEAPAPSAERRLPFPNGPPATRLS